MPVGCNDLQRNAITQDNFFIFWMASLDHRESFNRRATPRAAHSCLALWLFISFDLMLHKTW